MPTHVDEIVTEVIPEPLPAAPSQQSPQRWTAEEQLRAMSKRLASLRARVSAEGLDD